MIDPKRLQERFFRYVTCPSESGRERNMCLLLESELTALGLPVRREEIGGEIGSDGWNIYTRLEGGGEPLLLAAHMDTVPPGEHIRPVVRDGVIYSSGDSVLGADDKAGVAAIMEALQAVVEQDIPHRTVEVLFTISEETGLKGAGLADYGRIESRQAVVLDSGTPGKIVTQTPVLQSWAVSVFGKASHSGSHYADGIHALKCAAEAVARIDCGCVDSMTAINIANFLSPGKGNVVPDRATFELEIRCFDPAQLEAHMADINRILGEACSRYGAEYQIELLSQSPGMSFPAGHPLLPLVEGKMEALGLRPQPMRTYGGNDGAVFSQHGIAALNVGVGFVKAHSTEEHIAAADLQTAARLAEQLMMIS